LRGRNFEIKSERGKPLPKQSREAGQRKSQQNESSDIQMMASPLNREIFRRKTKKGKNGRTEFDFQNSGISRIVRA
jgi:hypothetical protein